MARRRAKIQRSGIPTQAPLGSVDRSPERPVDHLAGQHYEDFLSVNNGGKFHPVTALQAQLMGPVEDDIRRRDLALTRAWRGEDAVKREDWEFSQGHGGGTYVRGSVLGDILDD